MVQQRRKTFIKPATPIKRPSVKAARYAGLSNLTEGLGKLAEEFDKEDTKKKKPPKHNIVAPLLKNDFMTLNYKDRLKAGSETKYYQKETYDSFRERHPDIDITRGEFEDVMEEILNHDKRIPLDELRKSFFLDISKTGGPFLPEKGRFPTLREVANEKAGFDIMREMSDDDANKYKYQFNYTSHLADINNNRAKRTKSGVLPNYERLKKDIVQSQNAGGLLPNQVKKLLQVLDNAHYGSINSAIQKQNAIDRWYKNKSIADMDNVPTTGMGTVTAGTQVEIRNKQYDKSINKMRIEMQDGDMTFNEAMQRERNWENIDGDRRAKGRKIIDGEWFKIKKSIFAQPRGSNRGAKIGIAASGVVVPTDGTEFGQEYISRAYTHLSKNPVFMNSGEMGRQTISRKALNNDNTNPTRDFNDMANTLTNMGIKGTNFADVVHTGNPQQKADMANYIRNQLRQSKSLENVTGANLALQALGRPKFQRPAPPKKKGIISEIMKLIGVKDICRAPAGGDAKKGEVSKVDGGKGN